MDLGFALKLSGTIISALAAWWGFRKFRYVVNAYRETLGPRAAQPFTSLTFSWSGDLDGPRFLSLVFHIANRERKPFVIQRAEWFVPLLRLKWDLDAPCLASTARVEEGEGVTFELDPAIALAAIEGTRHFKGWLRKILMVCELRLFVHLQTGESIALRIPGYMRAFLAIKYGFSRFSRAMVRIHALVWP